MSEIITPSILFCIVSYFAFANPRLSRLHFFEKLLAIIIVMNLLLQTAGVYSYGVLWFIFSLLLLPSLKFWIEWKNMKEKT